MVARPLFEAALGVASFLALATTGDALHGAKTGASPGYHGSSSLCPERCSVAGPNTGNWSVYPDFRQIKRCDQTMFYDFSLHDPVDEAGISHRIQACSSFGPDISMIPRETMRMAAAEAETVNVEFEVGWWEESYGLATCGIKLIAKQIRKYVDRGHGAADDKPFIGLLNQGLIESALKVFEDNLANFNVSSPTLAMQLCQPEYVASHIFGVMVTSNGTFSAIQTAMRCWTNATCLSFASSTTFAGTAQFSTPLLSSRSTNHSVSSSSLAARNLIHRADERSTVQVEAGNLCGDLAAKCGISVSDLQKYNPGSDFCTSLKVKQHVCCSSGDLPDFRPKPNEDGSCKAPKVQQDEDCTTISAEYGLTMDELDEYNQNTWGWSGCDPLFKDTIMCLSEGSPPFPDPIANAFCGPNPIFSASHIRRSKKFSVWKIRGMQADNSA